MVEAKHRASRWRRRFLGLPVAVWLLGLAGTALAVAGFLVLLGTSGSVTAGQAIDVSYKQTGGFSVVDQAGAECTVQRQSNAEIRITAANAYPGGHCTFSVRVENGGQAAARLQAFRLNSPAVEAAVQTCGQTLAAMNGDADVRFTLTFTDDLQAGQQVTFNPASDGLEWVAANLYNAADCNT